MKRFVFKRATRLKFPNDHSDPCSVFVSTWQAKKNVKKTLASYSFSENKRTKTVVPVCQSPTRMRKTEHRNTECKQRSNSYRSDHLKKNFTNEW